MTRPLAFMLLRYEQTKKETVNFVFHIEALDIPVPQNRKLTISRKRFRLPFSGTRKKNCLDSYVVKDKQKRYSTTAFQQKIMSDGLFLIALFYFFVCTLWFTILFVCDLFSADSLHYLLLCPYRNQTANVRLF